MNYTDVPDPLNHYGDNSARWPDVRPWFIQATEYALVIAGGVFITVLLMKAGV